MARINGSVAQRQDSYEFYIIWEETDINIANNTSKVTATSYIYCKAHTAYNYDTYNHTITIDGQTFTTAVDGVSLSPGKTVKLANGSKTITHTADGSKKITISASSPTLPAGGGWGPYSGSASKEVTLTTIPRASSVTCADGNIGSSTTINISRASSSFTHTLTYKFGDASGTIVNKTSETSIGWTIPTSFFAQIPDSMNGEGTITCDTYSEDKLVGTKTCKFNAFVINSNPTITATVVDTNETTLNLTGDENILIKYYSNASVTVTATPKNSARITSIKVIAGNSSSSGNTTFNSVETNVFDLRCKDSRGLFGYKTITKEFVDYIPLAFTRYVVSRTSSTSNIVRVSLKGNYFNGSFGSVNNTLTLKFRSRLTGGSWSSYTTLTPTITNNTFSFSGQLGTNYDYNESYEFQFVIQDKLDSTYKSLPLTVGKPIIDIGKKNLVVNGEFEVTGGNVHKMLENGTDFNELKLSNTYTFISDQGHINCPVTTGGSLEVLGNNSTTLTQRLTTRLKSGSITYQRHYYSGTWGDWVIMPSSKDIDDIFTRLNGYGEQAYLISNQDLNTICGVNSGFYRGTKMTNAPGTGWYFIFHLAHYNANGNYCRQIAFDLYKKDYFVRYQTGGTWSEWVAYNNFSSLYITDILSNSLNTNILTSSDTNTILGTGSGISGVTTSVRGNTVRLYAHTGGAVYLGNSGSTAVTSDENLKNIFEMDDKYVEFFTNLKPITYIYKDKGHRKHMGFGARQVEQALIKSGLTTEQFAGVLKDKDVTIFADENGTDKDMHYDELYSLRYEEFIALNTMMIQKQAKEIENLKNRIKELEETQ